MRYVFLSSTEYIFLYEYFNNGIIVFFFFFCSKTSLALIITSPLKVSLFLALIKPTKGHSSLSSISYLLAPNSSLDLLQFLPLLSSVDTVEQSLFCSFTLNPAQAQTPAFSTIHLQTTSFLSALFLSSAVPGHLAISIYNNSAPCLLHKYQSANTLYYEV